MSEIFFVSDSHHGHKNIIQYSNRPFSSVEEMDESLIENWNANIRANDIVYHLGDFSFYKNKNKNYEIFSRLNGRKYLILGNHDHSATTELPWLEQHSYYELNFNKKFFVLCHYPILSWNKCNRDNSFHLYGHTHETLDKNFTWVDHTNKYHDRAYHVGVDSNNYTPIHIDELLKIFENRIEHSIHEEIKAQNVE